MDPLPFASSSGTTHVAHSTLSSSTLLCLTWLPAPSTLICARTSIQRLSRGLINASDTSALYVIYGKCRSNMISGPSARRRQQRQRQNAETVAPRYGVRRTRRKRQQLAAVRTGSRLRSPAGAGSNHGTSDQLMNEACETASGDDDAGGRHLPNADDICVCFRHTTRTRCRRRLHTSPTKRRIAPDEGSQ